MLWLHNGLSILSVFSHAYGRSAQRLPIGHILIKLRSPKTLVPGIQSRFACLLLPLKAVAATRMASTIQPQEFRDKYRERIKRLSNHPITPWPGLESLRKFIENGYACHFSTGALRKVIEEGAPCKVPPEISIVNIPGGGSLSSKFSMTDLKNPHDLFERLPSLADDSSSSQLIIIENICSETLTLLGGYYDIDPQIFAQYTNVLSWYQMREKVPERLTSLPSTRKAEDFLLLRYVSTRELYEDDDASIRARSVIWPDMKETRLGHSAGRLKPISGPEDCFPPMAFTRQCFSVWCKKKINCDGWIGTSAK
jgi:hypothetical protein